MTRIALLSPSIGNGNLGDEATVAAVIQNIRRRCPTATIHAFSPNPDDTLQRHGLPAFPATRDAGKRDAPVRTPVSNCLERHAETMGGIRQKIKAALKTFPMVYKGLKALRTALHCVPAFFGELKFLATSLKRLKGVDLFVISGSGVLSDHFGGPFNLPYTIFKWSLLAKATRARIAFLSVGAGPLRSPLSRRLIKYSLALASYRSSRDVTSKRVLEGLGVSTPVFPDLANSLNIDPQPSRPTADRPIVGINAFPHYAPHYWPETDITQYRRYLSTLGSFVSWLIHNKYTVLLFPTQIRADVLVMQDLKKILAESGGLETGHSLLEFSIQSVDDLTSRLGMTDLIVATRFHGILLSLLMHKPVLALSNHHKMTDLMTDMGQSHYLLDINTFTCESLIERFTLLEFNRESVSRQIARRVSEYRRNLDKQYDVLLAEVQVGPAIHRLAPEETP